MQCIYGNVEYTIRININDTMSVSKWSSVTV